MVGNTSMLSAACKGAVHTFMSPSDATKWISSALMDSRSKPCAAERAARFAVIFSRLRRFFSPGRSLPLLAPRTAAPLRFCPGLEFAPAHTLALESSLKSYIQLLSTEHVHALAHTTALWLLLSSIWRNIEGPQLECLIIYILCTCKPCTNCVVPGMHKTVCQQLTFADGSEDMDRETAVMHLQGLVPYLGYCCCQEEHH